ncbi:MAG: dihydroorotate dehydrogenase [Phycisphaeraceae bacterium]
MTATPASTTATPTKSEPDVSIDLAGLKLANPMMTASGTCGYACEYGDYMDMSRLGAFVTKSISPDPRKGNEAYRIVETRGGMLNAIGLANVGLEAFLAEKLPQLKKMRETGPRIIVNAVGHTIDEYVACAGRLSQEETVDAIELNVSCPNVKDGLVFGTNPPLLKELITQVRKAMRKACRLIVKLSPNAGDICGTARAAIEGGAQVLSMINTFNAMAIDIHKRKTRLANGSGGLSGPAVRPLAIYQVCKVYREVAKAAGVPIIGMGGIQYWQDAAEFVLAGATGLAVGTALFVDPATPNKVLDGLKAWLAQLGAKSLSDVVGTVQLPGDPPPAPYP